MNAAAQLTHDSRLTLHSLVRPLGRPLVLWLAALRSSLRIETRPTGWAVLACVMGKGHTLWVDQPKARVIKCLEGTLWLTFDGVREDFIVEAGHTYRCDCTSRLAIHALETARFSIT